MKAPEAFVKAYIAAALWSTTGDDDQPLDANHTSANLAPSCLEQMRSDCAKFWAANANDLQAGVERAGHDFWLTRNGHGCGFGDGDWPEEIGERLTVACETFGETCLYVGDDGLIYC